jgi:hypothetical protein
LTRESTPLAHAGIDQDRDRQADRRLQADRLQEEPQGRQCQDVLQGDVGVQVPAGKASGQPNVQSVFGLPASVTQSVAPGAVVPVTVHHNGCYGETAVEKTVDELHGSLSGTIDGAGPYQDPHVSMGASSAGTARS